MTFKKSSTVYEFPSFLSVILINRYIFAWQIAIMGCIVNGPGEMADADFGYVGGAPGKIDLYVGKVIIPLLGCQNHVYEMESFTMLLSSSCAFVLFVRWSQKHLGQTGLLLARAAWSS
jgi:hypothetical protein